jgi:hypothetical protein
MTNNKDPLIQALPHNPVFKLLLNDYAKHLYNEYAKYIKFPKKDAYYE